MQNTVEIDPAAVGLRLKNLRENSLDLSLSKFGKRYDRSKHRILYIEQGKVSRQNDLLDFCKQVSDHEGVNLEWLLTGDGEMIKEETRGEGTEGDRFNNNHVYYPQEFEDDVPDEEMLEGYFNLYPARRRLLLKVIREGRSESLFRFLEDYVGRGEQR